MLYREIIAVCSEIHTKHINTLCGQNVEFVNVKLVVHIVTTGPCSVNIIFTLLLLNKKWEKYGSPVETKITWISYKDPVRTAQ